LRLDLLWLSRQLYQLLHQNLAEMILKIQMLMQLQLHQLFQLRPLHHLKLL
jgi:hypothetical protein